ncbi:F-box/kelch-repeat protein At3g23880-like [Lathyrus oleraceus]|uniref:F-box/kelch-repeat protein At3g23880-like n=1 Tax=Pisum sativum TaxID=3888 RepID=UPI0021D313C2|nr:F-box/kelch-repeat protein At3g23880-like [Pisum sativum]
MLETAAIQLPDLPEELVSDILLRLPVKSLLQFKCVCKSWKTLISDSQFAKNHLRISTSDPTMTNQQLVFSYRKPPWEIVSYPLKPLFQNPTTTAVKPVTLSYKDEKIDCIIIGSCNGLLCLLDSFPRYCVRLCNPCLRLISKISSVPVSQDWLIMHCGFAYDQVNDKYKVLLVVRCKKHDHQIFTKIYTFGQDDSWRTIPNLPYDIHKVFGKFVSGTLNFLLCNKNTFVSFDIEKETYMELLLPQNYGHNNDYTYRAMSVLSDCLCVSECENLYWVVWMMKEYGDVKSWTKFIIVSYDKLIRNRPCLVEPLFISKNGVLMVMMDDQLILYNSNNGVALDPLIVMKLGFFPHIHCDSLVLVPCLKKCN